MFELDVLSEFTTPDEDAEIFNSVVPVKEDP